MIFSKKIQTNYIDCPQNVLSLAVLAWWIMNVYVFLLDASKCNYSCPGKLKSINRKMVSKHSRHILIFLRLHREAYVLGQAFGLINDDMAYRQQLRYKLPRNLEQVWNESVKRTEHPYCMLSIEGSSVRNEILE